MKLSFPRTSILALLASFMFVPFISFAQTVTDVPSLFTYVLNILNGYVVPLIFALAFLMFLIGVYRYFIAGGASEEKVAEGQKFVMWSVIGFVIMFSIWGLINLFINSLGFDSTSRPALPTFGAPGAGTTNSPTGSSVGGGSTNFNPTGTVTNSSNCGSFNSTTGTYGTVCSTGYSCVNNNQCVLNAGVNPNTLTAQCGSFNDYICSSGQVCNASGMCVTDPNSNGSAASSPAPQTCTDGSVAPAGGSCYSCGNGVTTANGANCPANTTYSACSDGTATAGQCITCQSGVTTSNAGNCLENDGTE
jgi:hypothetical protein